MSKRTFVACIATPLWLVTSLAAQGKPAPAPRANSRPSVSVRVDPWIELNDARLGDLGRLDGMWSTLGDLSERLNLAFNEGFNSDFNVKLDQGFGDDLAYKLKTKLGDV